MRLICRSQFTVFASVGVILLLAGCSGSRVDLDSSEHADLLRADRAAAEQRSPNAQAVNTPSLQYQNGIVHLSLEDAIKRGLSYNLDARVAAMEALSQQSAVSVAQLRALPGVTATGGYSGRDSDGSSSSRSVLTGQQSLEPSISTDQHRRTASLEMNWNLLDAAIALADATRADDDAGVARERHTKVIQNVERDVYAAYWRALTYQDIANKNTDLLTKADAQLNNFDLAVEQDLLSADEASEKSALIIERQKAYRDLHDRLQLAEIELKSMLSLPLDAKLVLTTKRKDITGHIARVLEANVTDQEWTALENRPEMREEILKKNITIMDTRREVFQTFPGFELFYGKNYDSNQFLTLPNWDSWSLKIVQSLTGIFTLPGRYTAAKDKQLVADARRQALSASILAQTHIGRARLATTAANYRTSEKAEKAAQRKAAAMLGRKDNGFAAGEAAMRAAFDAAIEEMRSGLAYAEMQEAFAAFNNTLGLNLRGEKTIAVAERGSR